MNDWVVINRFWFEGSNLRVEDGQSAHARFDSLIHARSLERKAIFDGQGEPLLLKKMNILSYYPIDFLEYKPAFEVWGPHDE